MNRAGPPDKDQFQAKQGSAGNPVEKKSFVAMMNTDFLKLVHKYNIPVPRYTSYPTAPYWTDQADPGLWKERFTEQFLRHNAEEGISLYVHLPFCESLCTYCGCNKKITTNHGVEAGYLELIGKEYRLYTAEMPEPPLVREIHLGGGTPTFFSPANLSRLVSILTGTARLHPEYEFSIEGHPNNTSGEHLRVLAGLGFRRISFGVQDNDPHVQRLINRIQPFENLSRVTKLARETGFRSVNFDLIYGLPGQTLSSIRRTFEEVLTLRPDRIAFYSYAHVPWVSKGQRLFDETDLPPAEEKIGLYLEGKRILLENGYADIGMDHFSLPSDDLYLAWKKGELHRNFMGYTTQKTSFLLGLGVSAISDIGTGYVQNLKKLREYEDALNADRLPVFRGRYLSEEDRRFRNYITSIICNGQSFFQENDLPALREYTFPLLAELESDHLVRWNETELVVLDAGLHFVRNICSAFDLYLQRTTKDAEARYSNAI